MDAIMTNNDTLTEILSRVPFADQANLACVSSAWAGRVGDLPRARAEAGYLEAVLVEFHAEDYESDSDEEDSDSESESEDEEEDLGKMTSTVTMISQTGVAKSLPPLPQARVDFATANLNGKLYVVGGRNAMFKPLTLVHVYDPAANTWTACASMAIARTGASCTAVDGKLVVAGGWSGAGHLRSAEMYDPSTDSWTTIASMRFTRAWAMAECVNGKVVVAGGVSVREAEEGENVPVMEEETEEEEGSDNTEPAGDDANEEPVENDDEEEEEEEDEEDEEEAPAVSANISIVEQSVEVYDLKTDSWSTGAELPRACSQAASVVHEGAFIALGGKVEGTQSPATSKLDASTWTDMPAMPVAVAGGKAIRLSYDRVAVVGGERAEGADGEGRDQVLTVRRDGQSSWSNASWSRVVGCGENTTCAAVWM